ncbi:hypothetical protein DL990_20195 [Amycolatopsis sp. WAC 01416]|uniref:hypothetical protein n=1 Tax=Amycolatopsis sp. WAC 01416 TaxID=2203196 RepID=UPI000F7AF60C|nr:hypothetical protein [Amycolatopsis sp. WAC 01416]RSN32237.1 hypothetical protein DL990_20195 [Amycolatopsis sp. WAC 01416]
MSKNRFEWIVKTSEITQGGIKYTAAEAWAIAGKRAGAHLKSTIDSAAISVNGETISVTKGTLAREIAAKVKASK